MDILEKVGYQYILDWCHDDQPTWFKTSKGKILAMPYSQEINDIPAIIPNRASAAEFADMIIDHFDEMLEQSQSFPLVFGISLHPYIIGQPFRLRHLRRALEHITARSEKIWLTHPGMIANYYTKL